MPKNPIMVKVTVTLDLHDEIANKFRCPIANSIKESDSDILNVTVDRTHISYRRRSTGPLRYVHATPVEAQQFIDEIDALAKKRSVSEDDLPQPFVLILRRNSLVATTLPPKRDPKAKAVSRSSNAQVTTQSLKQTLEQTKEAVAKPIKLRRRPRGSRSQRRIPVA
jgi:hypothetical protein